MMLSGCGASSSPVLRTLPETRLTIPEPEPLPPIRAGQPWRITAAEARANAAGNIRRLESAGRNYDAIRKSYGAAE